MKKLLAASALCAVATTASVAPAKADSILDKLYAPLVQEYWIWAYNEPEEVNPLLGNAPFCKASKSGTHAFFAGTFTDGPQTRSCQIKAGQFLYLSVLSSNYIAFKSDAPETKTEEAMLSYANVCTDATATVTVDGIPFNTTWSYTKTGKFAFPVKEGGLLEDLLEGEEADGAVVAGIHVVLPPLPRGTHSVKWHAESLKCGNDTNGDGVPDQKLLKDFNYTVKVN